MLVAAVADNSQLDGNKINRLFTYPNVEGGWLPPPMLGFEASANFACAWTSCGFCHPVSVCICVCVCANVKIAPILPTLHLSHYLRKSTFSPPSAALNSTQLNSARERTHVSNCFHIFRTHFNDLWLHPDNVKAILFN